MIPKRRYARVLSYQKCLDLNKQIRADKTIFKRNPKFVKWHNVIVNTFITPMTLFSYFDTPACKMTRMKAT